VLTVLVLVGSVEARGVDRLKKKARGSADSWAQEIRD
jgi:hypothetical protein